MMRRVRLLCLANSTKHNGRCVAGIRLDTGEWVRPVSSAEDGTLSPAMCTLDIGREAQPLDIIDMDLIGARPEPHQPENWVIASRPWQLAEQWSVGQAVETLDPATENGPALLGGTSSRIPVTDIEANPVTTSLAVVRVTAPHFVVNTYGKVRARFSLRGQHYDLSVSDREPWVDDVRRQHVLLPSSDWYLTISLTEPFSLTGACHKLVAAGIEIA
jgi:hypothetical protein